MLFLLPSYHENLGKSISITKSPKLFFYDVGLAAALMGFDKEIIVKQRMAYGALFENMIIVDLMKNVMPQHYTLETLSPCYYLQLFCYSLHQQTRFNALILFSSSARLLYIKTTLIKIVLI